MEQSKHPVTGSRADAPARPRALCVRGGFVYTADEADRIHPSADVLIIDGRVAYVGPSTEVETRVEALVEERKASLETIDARGMMVLPGFVNPHWHDVFAARVAFRTALRDCHDQHDPPGFLARGGDMHLISTLFDRFGSFIELMDPAEAEAIAHYSVWTQLRAGTTTLGDVGSLNHPRALANAVLNLGMRGAISTWASDVVCAAGETRPRRTRDAERLLRELEDLFELARRAPRGRLEARPSAVYVTNMSDELGRGLAALCARFDATFTTHVGAQRNESAFVREYFGATSVRRLHELGLLSPRTMAVHCAFADEEEVELLVKARVHINHSPAKYGGSGESTLSETRLITRLIAQGLDVSLSTDGTTLPLGGMAENLRAAFQMHNELQADQTFLPPSKALAMATRVAARGLGWESEVGSLSPGKQGDLVLIPLRDYRYLLNPRPLEAFVTAGGSLDIDTVVVGGETVLRHGRATRVDEIALERDFLSALRSFSLRVPGVDKGQVETLFKALR